MRVKPSTLILLMFLAWACGAVVLGYNFKPHNHGAEPKTEAAGHF